MRIGLGLPLRATLRGVRGSMGPSWLGLPLAGAGRARVIAASEVVKGSCTKATYTARTSGKYRGDIREIWWRYRGDIRQI